MFDPIAARPRRTSGWIMPGVVCIPYGWGHGLPGTRQAVATDHAGVNVNVLTDASAIDPMSGNAVLNGIPVAVAAPRTSACRPGGNEKADSVRYAPAKPGIPRGTGAPTA